MLLANNVDPDQMPHDVAPDLDLHCVPDPFMDFQVKISPNKTCHRDRIARLTAPCPSHKNFNVKTLTF